jgi:hypothetical protein
MVPARSHPLLVDAISQVYGEPVREVSVVLERLQANSHSPMCQSEAVHGEEESFGTLLNHATVNPKMSIRTKYMASTGRSGGARSPWTSSTQNHWQ